MIITENLLKKILVDTEIISLKDFNLAIDQACQKSEPLEQIIIEKGFISDDELGQLIADEIGFPVINLRKIKINKEVLSIVPEIVAKKQEIIVFERIKEGLKVAMANPENLEIREFIERKTGEKVIPYFATKNSIKDSFKFYRKEIKEEFEEIIGKNIEDLKKVKDKEEPLPAIKTVDLILNSGYENRASDIHIEPYENKIILRYRIDGVLHDVLTLPKEVQDFLVSRIKIMARLRTDVHDAAQDGHFSFPTANEKVDVRVSVVPIEEGEKIVMRVLAEKSKKFDLKELGFLPKDLNLIKENLKKPWGMIISSGPTGCGKTTTLYALLKILNTRDVNIMTIEDPIEYDIEGINQIQVNAKTHLTFSKGLRSIMRQDPNIIMVGEIRDSETAKLAVSAAMTGHLVLSTFHAIDASTVLTRLTDIGIEPYIISSTVNIIIAQRLVRKICPKCIESYEISSQKLEVLLSKDLISKLPKTKKGNICLFKGKGCPVCQKTGYLGRVGIFEILEMNDPIKKLVMEKANASQIRNEALKSGMTPMIDDGLLKAENGLTTLEEILKAVK
ncbi:MAG: GspE/PulE family protein [Candidatus Nealsonbacteria bacterium]|nr:GspE/PulE family protein [Candidatus Nealsonbacteria bacterium]